MKYRQHILLLSTILSIVLISSLFFVLSFIYFPEQINAATAKVPSCILASNKNLKLGVYNVSVLEMQKVLNLDPETQVSITGAGSPGQESSYFGLKTKTAVAKFQNKYANDILKTSGQVTGSGSVGVDTRNKIYQVCVAYTDSLSKPKTSLIWGAYTGDTPASLNSFETLVGKSVNIQSIFVAFNDPFPSEYLATVGEKGKIILIFWEPLTGYDKIIDGSQDIAIRKFALASKAYKYPIILAPFHEMNLNEGPWGYGIDGNTAEKFKVAWIHVHNLFTSVDNVKFAIAFNNDSVPNIAGNKIADYYPGDIYVDYVGVDGFNFGKPWQSFDSVFDSSMSTIASYNKPVYIFSLASAAGNLKASWIKDGLGSKIKTYKNIAGWVWFNVNKEEDWRVNSDSTSLDAFKSVIK